MLLEQIQEILILTNGCFREFGIQSIGENKGDGTGYYYCQCCGAKEFVTYVPTCNGGFWWVKEHKPDCRLNKLYELLAPVMQVL